MFLNQDAVSSCRAPRVLDVVGNLDLLPYNRMGGFPK